MGIILEGRNGLGLKFVVELYVPRRIHRRDRRGVSDFSSSANTRVGDRLLDVP